MTTIDFKGAYYSVKIDGDDTCSLKFLQALQNANSLDNFNLYLAKLLHDNY